MSSNPLVSIVIPVYNGANYVAEAVQSALEQTYENVEVVVVDDGSTDGGATRAVVESFGDKVRYLVKPNGGVATALNHGIANMRGELFSWLSHDDLYLPEKVERQVERWQSFGHRCIVIGDFELVDLDRKPLTKISIAGNNLVARPLDGVFRGLINGCTLLIPRELFQQAGQFEPGLPTTQDYELWYRMARLVPFVHCPGAYVQQRIHPLQGSRLSSHVDEASRMFSHLVDETPVSLMRAYDGSELRFLLRTRRHLETYPGLKTYLTFRIEQLLRHLRYSIVMWSDTKGTSESALDFQLRVLSHPTVLHIRYPSLDRSGSGLIAAGTSAADVLESAYKALSGGTVIFSREGQSVTEEQIRGSLEELILADADVVKASNDSSAASELHGLTVRHDALPAIAEALRKDYFHGRELRDRLQVVDSQANVVEGVETPAQLASALRGESRVQYGRRLSEWAILGCVREMLSSSLPTILFVQHSFGGGAHLHLNLQIQALVGKANTLVVYGTADGTLRLCSGTDNSLNGLVFQLPGHLPDLVRILKAVGVGRVDVHHTLDFEDNAELLLDALGLPFDVTIVDYHLIAKSPFLSQESGEFVGDENLQDSSSKMLRRPPSRILKKASRVIAISRDLAQRYHRLSPGTSIIPARLWHDTGVRVNHIFTPRFWDKEPLRVAIAGNIAPHKGLELLVEVATSIAHLELPIHIHLLGHAELKPSVRQEVSRALTVHGWYSDADFSGLLGSVAPHLAWIPARVPETWSYVLSHWINAAMPIAATAIGAISERCHGRESTWLLPREATADDWVDLFLRLHASKLKVPPRWADISNLPASHPFYFHEYLMPLSGSKQTAGVLEPEKS